MRKFLSRLVFLVIVFSALSGVDWAQNADLASSAPQPDDRFKADILVVIAHPDDDSAAAAYLARAVFDQGKRVAVVYTTDGKGGNNQIATERGAALGAVRQIEARTALAALGINQVWFLQGRDTATQNVLLSLANWGHGQVLEDVVRIIRLTRPEVVMTWFPHAVAGENHGDHQASAVVATEGFDLAGNPTVFPGQLAPPRLRFPTENLQPWQPKKLYFFSDAFDENFMIGKGPEYSVSDVSPARKVPYAFCRLAAMSAYGSQFGNRLPKALTDALSSGDAATALKLLVQLRPTALDPERFILGKSLVQASLTGDIFEGIPKGPIAYVPPPPFEPAHHTNLSIELAGTWSFYKEFWKAHGLAHLEAMLPNETAVLPGTEFPISLLLRNDSNDVVTMTVLSSLPDGWTEKTRPKTYPLPAHSTYLVQTTVTAPSREVRDWNSIKFEAINGTTSIGSVSIRVQVRPGAMPH